jgi:hypothetical protein
MFSGSRATSQITLDIGSNGSSLPVPSVVRM